MYGRSSGSAPSGILYLLSLSHCSSPAASVADRIRIWYSATSNLASILTTLILNCLVDLPAELAQVSANVVVFSSLTSLVEPLPIWPTPLSTVHRGAGYGEFAYEKLHVIGVATFAVIDGGCAE